MHPECLRQIAVDAAGVMLCDATDAM
ncbi:hypothetical protein SBA6_470009 [Candidatus Sulfopaludibacter sp. SbA6]|nr:hypothetical protein SBA6_470009 [Candidatus Sulfopaludibacter sp. SbA6]